MRHNSLSYSAYDVVEQYLDLVDLTPDPRTWTRLTATKHAPRYYRYQQLAALFRAFELPADFINFPNGWFLTERAASSYSFLSSQISASQKKLGCSTASSSVPDLYAAQFVFRKFFRLVEKVRDLQQFNSGVLEASSDVAQYAVRATGAVAKSLPPEPLSVITDTLSRLIDPAQRTFSQQQLMDEFGFPVVNLLDIDIDWM
jgi:hypothetical protein